MLKFGLQQTNLGRGLDWGWLYGDSLKKLECGPGHNWEYVQDGAHVHHRSPIVNAHTNRGEGPCRRKLFFLFVHSRHSSISVLFGLRQAQNLGLVTPPPPPSLAALLPPEAPLFFLPGGHLPLGCKGAESARWGLWRGITFGETTTRLSSVQDML